MIKDKTIHITLFFCPIALGFPNRDQVGFQECNEIKLNMLEKILLESVRLRESGVADVYVGGDDSYFSAHKMDHRFKIEGSDLAEISSNPLFSKLHEFLMEFDTFDYQERANSLVVEHVAAMTGLSVGDRLLAG